MISLLRNKGGCEHGIMQAHGFGTSSPDGSYASAHSSDPGHHDCLDDCRGMCFTLGSLDGTEPRAARLRRGQRDRTPLRWRSVVALSGAIRPEDVERQAARIAGALLFIVAACVALVSTVSLLGYHDPQPTYLGLTVLAGAALMMPWLAHQKRRLSAMTNSAALRADAAESALCAYLSWIALVGIGLNAIWDIGWADSAAALIIVPLIVREGFQSMRGRACACC